MKCRLLECTPPPVFWPPPTARLPFWVRPPCLPVSAGPPPREGLSSARLSRPASTLGLRAGPPAWGRAVSAVTESEGMGTLSPCRQPSPLSNPRLLQSSSEKPKTAISRFSDAREAARIPGPRQRPRLVSVWSALDGRDRRVSRREPADGGEEAPWTGWEVRGPPLPLGVPGAPGGIPASVPARALLSACCGRP